LPQLEEKIAEVDKRLAMLSEANGELALAEEKIEQLEARRLELEEDIKASERKERAAGRIRAKNAAARLAEIEEEELRCLTSCPLREQPPGKPI
jgi:hypothetical protein